MAETGNVLLRHAPPVAPRAVATLRLLDRPRMKNQTSGSLRAALLALGLVASPALAQAPPDPMADGLGLRERLNRLVERVKYAQNQIETLQARLIQHRNSDLLLKPEVDLGWFRYQPTDQLRWEIVEPKPVIMVVNGAVATTWHVDLGTAEVQDVGRVSEQVLTYMGPAGSLETLMQYFAVQAQFPEADGEPFYLHLTPDYPRVAKRVKMIDLWIDPVTYLPQRFKVVAAAGDERLVILEDMVLNEPIDEGQFALELPTEVEVSEVVLN